MGNVCCQTDINASVLENEIPHIHEYEEAQIPEDHENINHWLAKNNLTLPQDGDYSNLHMKTMKQINGDRYYVGFWKKGVPEGKGFIYEPRKILFLGNFHNGIPEGECSINFIEECIEFNGDLKEGKANGNGTVNNLKEKFIFTGVWEDSKPRKGKITLSDPNISTIEIKDYANGHAIIYYTDNRKYEGSINTTKLLPHGKGKVTFVYDYKKDYYEGDWHYGFMHGSGTYVWKDGSIYEGDFIQGRKEGKGKFIFPNANYYEGYWMKGKQSGVGALFNKNNEYIKKGIWEDGVFQKFLDEQEFKREGKICEERILTNKEEVLRRENEERYESNVNSQRSVSNDKVEKINEDEQGFEKQIFATEEKRDERNWSGNY